jgi:hypothetical protein
MFIFHTGNELDNIFHMKAIRTRGDRKGRIYKFEHIYFKIYDHPKKESTYIIQIFFYGKDNPFIEDDVPYNKMEDYVKKFLPL